MLLPVLDLAGSAERKSAAQGLYREAGTQWVRIRPQEQSSDKDNPQ